MGPRGLSAVVRPRAGEFGPKGGPKLRLRRLADQNVTGWHRYAATLDGHDVGMVVEDHEWKGWRYGGRRRDGAHVQEVHQEETQHAAPACWVTRGHRTRREAVEALRAHLVGCRGR